MSITELNNMIQRIRDCKSDYEMAHSLEDDMYRAVLTAIAENKTAWPQKLAQDALQSSKIEFARYTA